MTPFLQQHESTTRNLSLWRGKQQSMTIQPD